MTDHNKNIGELVLEAKQNGINLFLKDGRLQFKVVKGKVADKSIVERLRANKGAIQAFLGSGEEVFRKVSANEVRIVPQERGGQSPLSSAQERLWFVHNLHGTHNYHVPFVWRIAGDIDVDRLGKALKLIVGRHEILRTIYREEDGQRYQKVIAAEKWKLEVVNGKSKRQEQLDDDIAELIYAPFDLTKDYMVRAHLQTITGHPSRLVINFHHIAFDGSSMPVFVSELKSLYESGEAGLSQPVIQYADYAIWQRQQLLGDKIAGQLAYWEDKIAGLDAFELPTDFPRTAPTGRQGQVYVHQIDERLKISLKALAKKQDTTMFILLLGAFKVLMHKYAGTEDICVGSPVANRQQIELEKMIGLFVNTLALRSQLSHEMPFATFLDQLKDTVLTAQQNQEVPFEKVSQ